VTENRQSSKGENGQAGTIVWLNGVDFSPDVLYGLATGKPIATSPRPPVSGLLGHDAGFALGFNGPFEAAGVVFRSLLAD
jgi:hypothetical protein